MHCLVGIQNKVARNAQIFLNPNGHWGGGMPLRQFRFFMMEEIETSKKELYPMMPRISESCNELCDCCLREKDIL